MGFRKSERDHSTETYGSVVNEEFLEPVLLLIFLDPNVNQLIVVAKDLQNSLNELWNDLPIDTVISSILDPRTKWYPRIPGHEIKEAVDILKKVFESLKFLSQSLIYYCRNSSKQRDLCNRSRKAKMGVKGEALISFFLGWVPPLEINLRFSYGIKKFRSTRICLARMVEAIL